ncbi:MAG: hypothetical protein R3B67_06755 [Phycisphaerales bacterium]
MMDLSDGPVATPTASPPPRVRIELDATKPPISHRCDDWQQAVSEGEDYEP